MTQGSQARSECVDPATLAAFVDETLDIGARAPVEAHLADCADCREVWMETTQTIAALASVDADQSVIMPRMRVLRWIVPISVAAALVLAVLWFGRSTVNPQARPELGALVAAMASQRMVDGRLSGGFGWAPLPAPTRGSEYSEVSPEIRIAAARLDQELERDRTSRTLAAHATARLISGDVHAAVVALEESTDLEPTTAAFWSDLSVAYLARNAKEGDATDLPKALEAAERAVQLAPSVPEALFNRAVALERLGLSPQAAEAWRAYLAVDTSTPWSREAGERLSALEKTSANDREKPKSQHLRELLVDTLLAEWGAASSSEPAEAGELLVRARDVASTISRLAPSDAFAAEVVSVVSGADERRRRELARGHAEFGMGRRLYLAGQIAEAAKHFTTAAHVLRGARSPLAALAYLYESILHYRRGEIERCLWLLNAGRNETVGDRYPSVTGRIHWMFGNIAMVQGRHGEAAESYTRALEDFGAASEPGYEAHAWSLLANLHGQLGAQKQAWVEWTRALSLISGEPDSPQKQGLLLAAAEGALGAGWFRVASRLQQQALEVAMNTGNTAAVVDSQLRRAVLLTQIGRPADAATAINDARTRLSARPDETMAALQAELDLAEARIVLDTDPRRAIGAASRALDYYTRTGGTMRLPASYAALAAAQRRAADPGSAVDSLERGLAAAEEQRRTLRADDQNAYLDSLRSLSDEQVALLLLQERTAEAFDAHERMKSTLLRQKAALGAPPVSAEELVQWLPPRAIFVAFSLQESATLRWTIRSGKLTFSSIPASRRTIEQLIESLERPATSSQARDRLTDLLLGGVLTAEDRDKTLVLMLDGALHQIPFAGLRGFGHEYVVEEHPIIITPSATFLVHASRLLAQKTRPPVSILAVGNPPIDRRSFPDLDLLPEAAAEVADIIGLYSSTMALVGQEATPDAVLRLLPSADVFHFAGHAVTNNGAPAMSQLVVGDGETTGIAARDIERLELQDSRLIVLSACEAAVGPLSASEGPMNLIRPFLIAGAPVVVASLRKANDRAARRLMVAFHESYRVSGDAAAAMRKAQIEALRNARQSNDTTWEAFAVFGALSGMQGGDK